MALFVLLFCHFLADFPLQGDFMAKFKGKNTIIMMAHVSIWTGMICIGGYLLGFDIDNVDIISLAVVHGVADLFKANNMWFYKKLDPLGSGLYVDQSIHLLQILVFIGLNS